MEKKTLKEIFELSERIKTEISQECHISRATRCNWANGITQVPGWAQEKINTITSRELGYNIY